jgi:hypothetical protein
VNPGGGTGRLPSGVAQGGRPGVAGEAGIGVGAGIGFSATFRLDPPPKIDETISTSRTSAATPPPTPIAIQAALGSPSPSSPATAWPGSAPPANGVVCASKYGSLISVRPALKSSSAANGTVTILPHVLQRALVPAICSGTSNWRPQTEHWN